MSSIALAMIRGDNRTFTVTISGLSASGLTGATLYFTAKRDIQDADSIAVFKKNSTTGQGITITQNGDLVNPGIASVAVLPADTTGLPAYTTVLQWDCVMVDSGGVHTTVAIGSLSVTPDVYQAQ